MGEHYHNELKAKLCESNISHMIVHVIVQRVLKKNYHRMNFHEFKKEYVDLLGHYNKTCTFVFLWGAAVAYSENTAPDKCLVLPEITQYNGRYNIDFKRLVITHCGAWFGEFPRLAYLNGPTLTSPTEINQFIQFFTNPENERFFDFWRNADNNNAPACPDETTDAKEELVKELQEKCKKIDKQIDNLKQIKEEVQEIQEKLLNCTIYKFP